MNGSSSLPIGGISGTVINHVISHHPFKMVASLDGGIKHRAVSYCIS